MNIVFLISLPRCTLDCTTMNPLIFTWQSKDSPKSLWTLKERLVAVLEQVDTCHPDAEGSEPFGRTILELQEVHPRVWLVGGQVADTQELFLKICILGILMPSSADVCTKLMPISSCLSEKSSVRRTDT